MEVGYISRLKEERIDLERRRDSLTRFTMGTEYQGLTELKQHLLLIQLGTMSSYLGVLVLRIEIYEEETEHPMNFKKAI